MLEKKSEQSLSKSQSMASRSHLKGGQNLSSLTPYTARDGATLYYRHYRAQSTERIIIMVHGSASDSRYLSPLADFITQQNLAHVYLVDLRGHGPETASRGDIAYIGQLEDDLCDMVKHIRIDHPNHSILLGGHSSGGGLVARFASSRYSEMISGYLLLSPFLGWDAPTTNRTAGWAKPNFKRLILLKLLNAFNVTTFNHIKAVSFNLPIAYRDGHETLYYSYRLAISYQPLNYKKDLANINKKPFLLLTGSEDKIANPYAYKSVIKAYASKGVMHLIPGANHLSLTQDVKAWKILSEWIESTVFSL